MAVAPSTVYREALSACYASLCEVATHIGNARDDVDEAVSQAKALYGADATMGVFDDAYANIKLAKRAITDTINSLPPVDEGDEGENVEAL
jgi:hypothetical protein